MCQRFNEGLAVGCLGFGVDFDAFGLKVELRSAIVIMGVVRLTRICRVNLYLIDGS